MKILTFLYGLLDVKLPMHGFLDTKIWHVQINFRTQKLVHVPTDFYRFFSKIRTTYGLHVKYICMGILVNVRLSVHTCNCYPLLWSVTFLWCDGKIPTLAGTGWCYTVTHWCYAVTHPHLHATALHYNVTIHVCTDLNDQCWRSSLVHILYKWRPCGSLLDNSIKL